MTVRLRVWVEEWEGTWVQGTGSVWVGGGGERDGKEGKESKEVRK